MPITAPDLTAPEGYVEPSLFPDDDAAALTARLDAYIADGELQAAGVAAGAEHDAAVAEWAYHRAFHAVHVRLLGAASSTSRGARTESYLWSQIERFGTLADEHKASFARVLAAATAASAAAIQPAVPISRSSVLEYTW